MKKANYILYLTFLTIIILLVAGCGQVKKNDQSGSTNAKEGVPEISFTTFEHDFGKISEGEKVACVFSFQNSGSGDLVVSSATTSCGCTVPKFDKDPIPPGGKGSLEVIFDSSGRSGIQSKTITVRSNATKPVMILKITAEVITINN